MAIIAVEEDLLNVDTSAPLIKEGVYTAKFKELTVAANKKGTGDNLNIQLTLEDKAESVDGKTINPGFVLFDLISLAKTEKYEPAKRLKELQESANVVKSVFDTDDLLGKTCKIKVSVEKGTGEFSDKNRIKR